MTQIQHIEACIEDRHGPCPIGAGCTVIWCDTDQDILDPETGQVAHPAGAVLWHSHWDGAVHAEHRINPDHPALDHRAGAAANAIPSEPCKACKPLLPGAGPQDQRHPRNEPVPGAPA